MAMTPDQFEREKNFRVSLAIAKSMLAKGLITAKEYNRIKSDLIVKYQPVIGAL